VARSPSGSPGGAERDGGDVRRRHTSHRTLGARVRAYRQELGLSLNALSLKSSIAKSYIWAIEHDEVMTRPSAETVAALAECLGVTMSDLLGKTAAPPQSAPPGLRQFAKERQLPQADVDMLASIKVRGKHPQSRERWRFIYDAIRSSEAIDKGSRPRGR
jgi:transcriptional regulator with XRE-family HTH domain